MQIQIYCKTSSTQNADPLEVFLPYFELVKPSAFGNFRSTVTSKRTPSQPKVNPLPYLVEFESREQRRPRKRQIYVEAAVDGPHFVYTGKKLTAQMKFFTYIPLGKFCGEDCTFFEWGF